MGQSSSAARYEGSWSTAKTKKLDGTLTCQIKPLAKDRWQGRFWGVWQQVPFDYTVDFATANNERPRLVAAETAPLEKVTGTPVRGVATIDGASYEWIGNLTPARFDIQFTGSRYEGHIELKRVADPPPQR